MFPVSKTCIWHKSAKGSLCWFQGGFGSLALICVRVCFPNFHPLCCPCIPWRFSFFDFPSAGDVCFPLGRFFFGPLLIISFLRHLSTTSYRPSLFVYPAAADTLFLQHLHHPILPPPTQSTELCLLYGSAGLLRSLTHNSLETLHFSGHCSLLRRCFYFWLFLVTG